MRVSQNNFMTIFFFSFLQNDFLNAESIKFVQNDLFSNRAIHELFSVKKRKVILLISIFQIV